MKPPKIKLSTTTVDKLAASVKGILEDLIEDVKPLETSVIDVDPEAGVITVTMTEPVPPVMQLRKGIDPEVAKELIELSVLDALAADD